RFLERIDKPEKNWKFSSGDLDERTLWDEYMDAYQDMIRATATDDCPWYIIPADKKWFTRIAISTIINQTMKEMNLKHPEVGQAELDKFAAYRERLLSMD